MVIRFGPTESADGIALNSAPHPKGPGLRKGRPTRAVAERRAAAVETIEIKIDKRRKRGLKLAPFDRLAYQREYMREWRKRKQLSIKITDTRSPQDRAQISQIGALMGLQPQDIHEDLEDLIVWCLRMYPPARVVDQVKRRMPGWPDSWAKMNW